MQPQPRLTAAPHPEYVTIRPPDAEARRPWALDLAPEATVLEMALLIHAYGCVAYSMGDCRFRLVPRQSGQSCPTDEDIRTLFRNHRPDRWPRIRQVRSPNPCTCGAPGGYPHEPDCSAWDRQ